MASEGEAQLQGPKATPIEVDAYNVRWRYKKHYGDVGIRIPTASAGARGHKWISISPQDPTEFAVIVDLLRNEGPVYHYDYGENSYITTSNEDVGEGDLTP